MSGEITFRVYGDPRPQGSKRLWQGKRKDGSTFASMTEQTSEGLQTWRQRCYAALMEVRPETPIEGPVAVSLWFYIKVPKKKRWRFPAKAPDAGKLARGVEDELTGIIIKDDALIVEEHIYKLWADGDAPGALVKVKEI